ncbi:MAG: MDR family oxidoreductase [Bacillota bacterium]
MTVREFRALVVDQVEGKMQAGIRTLGLGDLPEGDVLVRVAYSSLNYKDGLAVTGKGKVLRKFPMVPGIDLAGTVEESASPAFRPGDQVVLTGWGVGEEHWGGYAQFARVRSEWLVPLPSGLTLRQAMAIGTAGFTAMLAVMALERNGLTPGPEILVTGASGGVGSVAVALLAKLGHNVVASTGRPESHEFLRSLGAREIMDRSLLSDATPRPLERARWGGAVDSVGGQTLSTLLSGMMRECSVASCGLAGGHQLNTTVMPFILRGVNLLGIDSVMCPQERRLAAWERLTQDLPQNLLEQITDVIGLEQVLSKGEEIVRGQVRGRLVVDVNA